MENAYSGPCRSLIPDQALCRYGARGALSLQRLSRREDGTLAYRMKRPGPDGSTHLLLTPLELLRKLAALVPPPKFNLTSFHGVFAPKSSLRARLVPTPPPPPAPQAQSPAPAPSTPPSSYSTKRRGSSPRRPEPRAKEERTQFGATPRSHEASLAPIC
ncbi:MAG: transposase [Myxococcaceae bacterium]